MIDIQLYIDQNDNRSTTRDYAKVDLFKDESITLTSSIQNIRDIARVFADYTRSFSLPANDTNNKIFKHFYNPDVIGLDGTTKKIAKIYLNYMPFREGFIYLDSTEMKNNKPSKYNITFYGGLITLKDKIKEETLISLANDIPDIPIEIPYTAANVKTGLTSGLYSNGVIFPLITSEKRLYYDSGTTAPNYDGNLYHAGSPDANRGLAFTDLKPAIKVTKIIDAIKAKYGISFTGFFDTTPVSNLYLWLSRASGEIINYKVESEVPKVKIINQLVTSAANSFITVTNDRWIFTQQPTRSMYDIGRHSSVFTISNITGTYQNITLRVIDEITGDVISEKTESGVSTITLTNSYEFSTQTGTQTGKRQSINYISRDYECRFEVHAEGGNVNFDSTIQLRKRERGKGGFESATYFGFGAQSATASTIDAIELNLHLPDMKVIDFLSGLFKMFNLTAFVKEPLAATPIIEIETLDDFYSNAANNMSGGTIDFTDFIDAEAHSIQLARPFSAVSFNYEETNTVLMNQHETEHKKIFGSSTQNAREEYNFLGKEYEVKVPFSHMKYERLYDAADNSLTYIQWGYSAGGDFTHEDATTQKTTPTGNYSPENIKPLLFYGINQTITGGENINWISDSPSSSITTYWRPSNSNEEGSSSVAPTNTINFDLEFNEWNRIVYNEPDSDGLSVNNTLFSKYYLNYIIPAFSSKKRIFKYKCFLPAKILTRYKLNDQIKIQDRLFRINSISTNLNTGETELELLNLTPDLDIII
jgi:hypothetical protein